MECVLFVITDLSKEKYDQRGPTVHDHNAAEIITLRISLFMDVTLINEPDRIIFSLINVNEANRLS